MLIINIKMKKLSEVLEPDIFTTTDYRTYLKDYFQFKKSKNKRYSFTLFSKFLKLSSRSFIQDIISGKKNLSLESMGRFRVLFPKHPNKFEHFRKLVLRDQAKNEDDRKYYSNQVK